MGCTRAAWVIDEITVALPTSGPIRTRLQARYSPACNAAFAYVQDTTLEARPDDLRPPGGVPRLHGYGVRSPGVHSAQRLTIAPCGPICCSANAVFANTAFAGSRAVAVVPTTPGVSVFTPTG